MTSKSSRSTKHRPPVFSALPDGKIAMRPDANSPLNQPSADSVELTPAAELEAVRQVSSSLTASLELPAVLEAILKIVFQLMKGVKNIHAFTYDAENDRLTFGAAVQADGGNAGPVSEPRPHGLTYTAARSGETIVVNDMKTHPLFADAPPHWAGAIVGLPLKIGRRVVGVMNAFYPRPRVFSQSELSILRLLAEQAAMAIENARLYQAEREQRQKNAELLEAERRRVEQLAGLQEITRALGVLTDARESYSLMTRRLAELLGAPLCLVMLYDPHRNELCARAPAFGIGDEAVTTIRYPLRKIRQVLDLQQHTVIVANSRAEAPALFDMLAGHLRIETALVASIGRAVGLVVAANKPGGFGADEARLMSVFAGQARALIENAQIFAEMSEAISREQRLNDVTRVISSTLDLPTVLSNIVQLAAELVGADASTLALASPDGQMMTYPYTYNLPEAVNLQPAPKGRGVAWHIVETGEPVLLSDYGSHPQALPDWAEAGVHAFIGVPVFAGEARLGALGLFSLDPAKAFGKRDLALAASVGRQAGVAIQNARRFEAEHHQVAALTALHETAINLSAHLELPALLQTIVGHAISLLGATAGGLSLLLEDGQTVELTYDFLRPGYSGVRLKLGEGLIGKVAQTGAPLVVDDYPAWPGRAAVFEDYPLRSLLGTPVKWQEQVLGVLTISDKRPYRFGPTDVEIARLFADQAAVAISNARLYEATRRQLQELIVLKDIATAGTEATTLDALIIRVTQIVGDTFYSDNFGVLLIDQTTGELVTHSSYRGVRGRVPLNVGVTGRVAATGQPWLVPDVSQEPIYLDVDPNTRSELCVPLQVGDQVIGVLNAESARLAAFDETDQRLLVTIAGQLATAIEKVRLFEAEHAAREQSEALYEVARTISSSLDQEHLLQLILEQLARVVEYDSAAIMLIDNDALEIVAHRGFRDDSQTYMPLKVDSVRHIFEVIETQTTLIIPDTLGDPRWNRLPGSEYIRCWLGAPLVVADRVIGLLNLDKEQAGFYTQHHAQLAAAFATQAAVAIQNARLYAEARAHAAELGQLYTAAREISASLDLKTVFEQLAKHFSQALSATSAYVLGVDLEAQTLTVLAEYWSAEASESERKSDLGRTYPLQDHRSFARVAVEPQFVARLASDPTLAESERNQLAEYGIKSLLIIPLSVRGQVIGLVEVWESRQPRLFTPVEMRLAETLSQHAASVMENARLYQALAHDKQRQELLYQLGQDLAARLDPEQVYAAIHRAAAQLMLSDAFAIALLDERRQEIELVYAVDRGARVAVGRMPATSGLSGYVIAQRRPMRVDDIDQLTDIEVAHFGGPERTRSLLAVPLQLGDKIIGAMTAQSYRLRAFSANDQQTLSTLGYQAAIAIENARLYAETQSRLLDQTLLYECGQALALAHNAQAAIAAVAERMVLRLGATALCYYSYHEAEDTIRVDYEYWASGASERERKSALGQAWPANNYPNTAAALRTRAIHSIRTSDPKLAPDERDMLIEWGGKTVLVVPVAIHDQAFGFFEIWDSQVERDYNETEQRLLMSLVAQAAIAIENARLLEETSRRAHDMALLNDITRAAVEKMGFDELLQTLADHMGELFSADGCYITIWDETRQATVPAAAHGVLQNSYPKMNVEPGEQTMTASVLRAGHALVADDVFNSPYISPRIAALFPTKSMMGLPLLAGDSRLGAALISFHQPHHFTPDEVALGEQAAGQIALAIAKARLFEAARRNAAELNIASDILRRLNASPQVVGVFPAIASELKALTQCERVSLALITEDRQKVIMAALDQPRAELSQGARFPLTATSASADILKGRTHLTPDLAAEAAYPAEKALYEAGFRSRINLPLRVGDQVIGALNFVWPILAGYTPVNLPLLEQIADAIALAIEKNRLFDETRRRDAILGALAYASAQLLKPGDLHDQLPDLLARLGNAAGVSRVYIFENHTAPDGTLLASLRFEWAAPGQTPQIDNPRLQNIYYLTRWMRTLTTGQPIFSLVRDLPPVERAVLEPRGIQSVVIVPIFSGNTWWGYLGFDECAQERIWLGAEIEALKSAAGALGAAFARQRSEAAERKQRELTEALRDTAAAISSTLNFDEVLERILANVGRVVPHDAADIMLVNAAGLTRVARCRGYAERGLEDWLLSVELYVNDLPNLRRMAETGKPTIIPDVYREPSWVDMPESRWIRSYAGAPIRLKGKVIGFINLDSATPDFFTPDHAEGLQAFVDQAAVAIDNAQLYNETSALYKASARLINPGGDLQSLAGQIALSVTREFEFAHCGVLLIDETGVELKLIARAGKLQEAAHSILPLDGPGLIALAARTGKAVYLPDVSADSNYVIGSLETRSEFVVPLRAGSKIIGALDLQSRELNIFDDRTRRIITAFAEHAALALENAQLLASLETSRQMAEDANRLKSEFLANTSHELRTPLTGIIGSLSMVLDDLCDSPEEEREFARIAYTASQRLLSIINDVLDIAKIEAGRMNVRLQAVDLDVLFKDVRALTRVQAEDKKLALEFRPPNISPYVIWADPDKVRQILLNLIGNALKFTSQGGVTVAAHLVEGDNGEKKVRIEVQDTGIGIALEKQAMLFQPFVQVDGSMTRKYGGTGLGLSISRRLAELMGGALTLFSAGEGQGATFTVTLPVLSQAELEMR
jgi:GAF domain-containing protein